MMEMDDDLDSSDDDLLEKKTENLTHLQFVLLSKIGLIFRDIDALFPAHQTKKSKLLRGQGQTLDDLDMPVNDKTGYYEEAKIELEVADFGDRARTSRRHHFH